MKKKKNKFWKKILISYLIHSSVSISKQKMEIIEKMTLKFQASGSSGHNDLNCSNFNEYDGGNYGGYIPSY